MGVNYADARATVESIALITASDGNDKTPLSLSAIADETLQSELEKRGYNVTRRQENETTAEIIKIG